MPNWCENRLSVTATNAMMMKAIAEKSCDLIKKKISRSLILIC
ncbi:hypothetical protein [Avibacterium paragallinarum]|nr:hypothetical protein [Avibacterium paragallinarum]